MQKRIVDLEADVTEIFNTYRAPAGDKTLSENDIREVLRSSTDSAAVEAAWKGYMGVGAQVAGKLRELVKLRNELATQLGFRDYFALRLALQEIDEALDRIEEGTYGICETCGEKISQKRLSAKPSARTCLKCAEQMEEERRE